MVLVNKPTICGWLLILSVSQFSRKVSFARMSFYILSSHRGYPLIIEDIVGRWLSLTIINTSYQKLPFGSVTHLDAARVNRTIFHNYPVDWYYIARI